MFNWNKAGVPYCVFVCLFVCVCFSFPMFQSNGLQEASGSLVQAPTSGFCCRRWQRVLTFNPSLLLTGTSMIKSKARSKRKMFCARTWSNLLCELTKFLIKCSTSLKFYKTRPNKVSKRENVWSCLIGGQTFSNY